MTTSTPTAHGDTLRGFEPRSVAMYNVNPGTVTHEYCMSVARMLTWYMHPDTPMCPIRGYYQRPGTSVLSIARNEACEHFLNQTDAEWMLQIDSDIEFPPDALETALANLTVDTPIVCGLYLTTLTEGLVGCAWEDSDGEAIDQDTLLRHIKDGDSLIPVSRTGAGFLWVHRDALLAMHEANEGNPWFGEAFVDGVKQGEDFTFCARARDCDLDIFLDVTAELGHVKQIVWSKAMLGNVQATVREDS